VPFPAKHQVMPHEGEEEDEQHRRDGKQPALIPPNAARRGRSCGDKRYKTEIGELIPALGEIVPLCRALIPARGVDVDGRGDSPHPAIRATLSPAGARVRKPCSRAQRAPTRKGEGLGLRELLGSR
jgi:hypothetical protein